MSNEVKNQETNFLAGQGDEWFRRNPLDMSVQLNDQWNRRLARMIHEGGRLLEIGCADGRRLSAIKQLSGFDGTFCGVEPSSEAVAAGSQLFPYLDLRVGTADQFGFDEPFDLILFGFCLCWSDRGSLFNAVAATDRALKNGGTLAIIDFDPKFPIKNPYHHLPGLWTFKMDYSALFLASPSYKLLEKYSKKTEPTFTGVRQTFRSDSYSLWIIRKSETDAYLEQP